jgi:hypothetical protein
MGRACKLALARRASRCRSASVTVSTYPRRGPPSSLSGPKSRSQRILPRRCGDVTSAKAAYSGCESPKASSLVSLAVSPSARRISYIVRRGTCNSRNSSAGNRTVFHAPSTYAHRMPIINHAPMLIYAPWQHAPTQVLMAPYRDGTQACVFEMQAASGGHTGTDGTPSRICGRVGVSQ